MKNYLIIYTQTSSKQINYSIPPEDYKNWSRIVSISWILNNNIETKIIRPIGFNIDCETSKHIGIPNETAIQKGEELILVLKKFIDTLKYADYIVGHNVEYHLNVIKSEFYRYNLNEKIPEIPTICLMKYGGNLIKSNSQEKSKYLTLSELNKTIFNSDLEDNYIPEDNRPYIANTNLFAIKNCFDFMLEKNVFSNIEIKPLPNFFAVQFDRDFEIVFKTKFENERIHYENSILFENVKSYEEFSNLGLSLSEIKNENQKSEFILMDFRGILILRLEKEITIGYHYGLELSGVFSGNLLLYYITHEPFFLLLHRYEFFEKIKGNLILSDFFHQKTLIKSNGEIQFINKSIIYNKKSNLFIIKELDFFRIYDYNFKIKGTFSTYDYDVQYIDADDYIYFLKDNLMGILNPEISILEKEKSVFIKPKFKYIEILTPDLILFSNHHEKIDIDTIKHYWQVSNITIYPFTVGDYGIVNYEGEILIQDIYQEISIVKNEVIGLKKGIKEKINFK